MEKLIEQLTELKDTFLKLSIELREKDPPHSYRTHQISEICRNAAKELRRMIPVEPELEGGGRSWWYACPECRSIVHYRNNFCAECGRKLKWKGFR